MKISQILLRSLVLLFTALFLLSFVACEKEEKPPVVPDPNVEDTSYIAPGFAMVPETKDIVMYEVNIRAFSQAGNLQGVTDRLDSIRALGVNVIWLMPIYPIGKINSVNSPYSIADYKGVNPEFGTIEDLKTLVSTAHTKGMAVILDWVANHTAWDHPWIVNKDWYTQVGGEIVHPPGTNWMDVADLNFTNAAMKLEMIEDMKYWIKKANVDGFRCDAADYVPQSFWKQAIDSIKKIPNRNVIWFAEGERNDHFSAGFQMVFSWDFYSKLKSVYNGQSAAQLFASHQSEYTNAPAGKHYLRFTTNHDESAWDATPVQLFGGQNGAVTAFVVMAYMGGVPLIYGSQEVGRATTLPFFTKSAINWSQNPTTLLAYKEIMKIYSENAALRGGTIQNYSHADIVNFSRKQGTEEIVLIANVRNRVVNYTLPDALKNTEWTNLRNGANVSLTSSVSLGNFEYQILKKK
jgi:glycosidase